MYVSSVFGITGPNNQTAFDELGAELQTMLQSIDGVLAGLDYNGVDPNTVIARTVALELWRVTATAKIAALETATAVTDWAACATAAGWTPGTGGNSPQVRYDRRLGEFRGSVYGGAANTDTLILPSGFPSTSRSMQVPYTANDGTVTLATIFTSGIIQLPKPTHVRTYFAWPLG